MLAEVIPRFPERAFDVGIAESHAIDMCAGMAKTGLRPFATIYSTFLQRGFDQIFQEVALQELPVRFCMDRAGLVGGDGAVHHGFLDVAFLRSFPKMVLTAAIDEPSLRAALEFMRTHDDGPSAVRYPRDTVPEIGAGMTQRRHSFWAEPICWPTARDHGDPGLRIPGSRRTRSATSDWRKQGRSPIAVYDARFAKPVDIELIEELTGNGVPIITVEDHHVTGGFGSCAIEACHDRGLATGAIHRIGLPDEWIYQGSRGQQLAEAGIDAESIAARAREIVKQLPHVRAKTQLRAG